MKQSFAILSLMTVFITRAEAQKMVSDTTYFNQYWDTCSKQEVYYTRVRSAENNSFKITDYYPDWKIQMTGYLKTVEPEIKEGMFKYYYEDGVLRSEGNFRNNKETGLWKEYRDNHLWVEKEYTNGKQNGFFKTYYDGKILKRQELYRDSNFIEGKCFTRSGADTAFFPFLEMAEFVGGGQKLYQFILHHLRYPRKAVRTKTEGTVRVLFTINKDGSLKDVRVKKPGNPYLDAEAVRVINSMPNWNPAKSDGEVVKMYYTIPITFKLD